MVQEASKITIASILSNWISDDPILGKHFRLFTDNNKFKIECWCGTRPSGISNNFWDFRYAGHIEEDGVVIAPTGTVQTRFIISHPLFFLRVRGRLYGCHNEMMAGCKEYLCQR